MRQLTEDTLTEAVIARLEGVQDARFKQLMTGLIRHLHGFAREVRLTEDEWFEAIKFLTAVGQKCDDKRQEFILLSDVLGLSMMTVAINHQTAPGATEATVLGPFFAHGAPEVEFGGDMTVGATLKGEPTWCTGRVTSVDGAPIPDATLDIWQAKADGVYDVQDPSAPFELRGRVRTDREGRFAFRTYKPAFYSIPTDGPVGVLVEAMKRHPMRPAHMHAIVAAPGHRQVITHVFVEGDPYLDSDAVFAVKDSLIGQYVQLGDAEAKTLGMPPGSYKLEFDFRLSPDEAGARGARKKIAASDAVA
jgi:hydroxyquinol 1,2-dioxygenase